MPLLALFFLIIAAILAQICMTLKVVVYLSEKRNSASKTSKSLKKIMFESKDLIQGKKIGC